ncbi:MAG TPA: HD domain-containing phosphohydrolase, partial [Anaerolineae bacterium]
RIISVADAYQAMTEDRSYRRALSIDQAISQLVAGSGTQFDPDVVQAFARVLQPQVQVTGPVEAASPLKPEQPNNR